jgi:4a-hydroxytetrahydrobiopterin dehydratase
MQPTKLSEEQLTERLGRLPGWKKNGEAITKTFAFSGFVQSMEFVNQLAETAEEMKHHPDIDIRYNKVVLSLSTHDAGGITELDINLAAFADELGSAVSTGSRS